MTSFNIRIVDLVTTDKDKKFEPAGRMADAIVTVLQKKGSCRPEDLDSQAFTKEEIKAHWHLAHSIARIEIKFMNANADAASKKKRPGPSPTKIISFL